MHPLGLPASLARVHRTLVMSVLNVTPDSFSDGGRYVDVDIAVAHALEQVAAGADIIDVGGESTRPGAHRIPAEAELDRVIPVVERLVARGVVVSIDTMRSEVAEAAVGAGASVVNDVSGGLADPGMHAWIADAQVPYIAMHWRGHSTDMQRLATYDDVVTEVRAELAQRLAELVAAGVDPARVVIDPGLGFAKTSAHNWALLAALPDLVALGHPVLIGASRKRFLGELLGEPGQPRPVEDRDAATDAVTTLAAAAGAWAVRVHDVRGSRDAIAVAGAWRDAAGGPRRNAEADARGQSPASSAPTDLSRDSARTRGHS
jgi:dihydropteroate synthase